jgi:hypothetical protein
MTAPEASPSLNKESTPAVTDINSEFEEYFYN